MRRLHKGPKDARQQAIAAMAAAGGGAASTGGTIAAGDSAAAAPGVARPSYRPPNALRAKQRVAPTNTPDRFEREVLGGRLWHPACQAAASDISEQIPLSFNSIEEYVATFDPLILEEARESLKSDWAETCGAAGRMWAVEVASMEEVAEGWAYVRLRAQQGHADMKRSCPANSAVVLTDSCPPPRGAIEWLQARLSGSGGSRAAKRKRRDGPAAPAEQGDGRSSAPSAPSASVDSCGGEEGTAGELDETADSSAEARDAAGAGAGAAVQVVAGMVRRGGDNELVVSIHPACAAHAHSPDAPCCAALGALRHSSVSGGGAARRWWLVPAKMLISNQREFDAVHHVRALDSTLLRFLLKPQLLAPIGEYYDNPEVRRGLWPEQAAQPAFIHYLRQRYDETQLEAIEMAACHLGAPADDGDGGKHPKLPFVLIQGPPGTGKTHTVKGMLNVWHLVAYQRFYDGLIEATVPSAAPTRQQAHSAALLNASGSNIVDVVTSSMLSTLGQKVTQTKPRILVCTPSNAACDELLTRVMTDGFADGNGRVYRPNVVRVGSERGESVNPAVRDRLVGLMVDKYRNMSQGDWQHRYNDLQQRHAHVSRELEALEVSLVRASRSAAAAKGTGPPGARGGGSNGAPADLGAAQQQIAELSKRLADRAQQQQRYANELERLQLAKDLVWGRRDQEWRVREAEQSIEASFLSEAEMVFTTLSSTQRKVFAQSASKAPFHTVLIDEAGQSSEVAALQPLVFGAKRVFLVGDPQQLPATILSELAKQVQMERSLFERLQQQGAPVKMLSVQYRMHPAIRQFPSAHFYDNRLRDADSIRDMPPAPFYAHPIMKPYVFFDVSKGQERRREGGGSLSNRAEALLAACLFAELRAFLINLVKTQPGAVTGPTTVGVITPYREQRKLIRETFEEVCGKGPASEVFIETVDSFQGKQLDVVMLSCVRASTGGGLGFVNDIRRLNVAITRAKRALWVLGSRATLRANPEWAALIGDAEQRGVVIEDAEAQDLLPDLPYWNKAEDHGGEGQGQGQGQREAAPAHGHHQLQQQAVQATAAAPSGPQQSQPQQQQQHPQPAAAGLPQQAPPQQGGAAGQLLPPPDPRLALRGASAAHGGAMQQPPLQQPPLQQQQQQQQQQAPPPLPILPGTAAGRPLEPASATGMPAVHAQQPAGPPGLQQLVQLPADPRIGELPPHLQQQQQGVQPPQQWQQQHAPPVGHASLPLGAPAHMQGQPGMHPAQGGHWQQPMPPQQAPYGAQPAQQRRQQLQPPGPYPSLPTRR